MKVGARYAPVDPHTSRERADERIGWLREYGARRIQSRLIDERRCIPPYVVMDLGNRGLFGVQVEERFGGLALRNRDVARLLEQAAAIDLGLGTFLLTSLFPGVRPIATFASAALKEEILPDLASGRVLGGYAQTEPGAGTHFPAMQARAALEAGGGWRLSGDKVWIGNGTWAGIVTVMAYEHGEDQERGGITALAVKTDQAGVAPGREMLSLGMRGMVQSEISFRDVRVPPEALVGERGAGLEVGVDSMSFSRFAIAATCVGAMRRCAQLMVRFAGRRSIATGRLLDHPVLLSSLGETVARIAASEALLYRVADALDEGQAVEADLFAVCKIVGSEFLWRSADALVQVLGSRGYDEANGVPQLLRDARVTRIFEGASEPLIGFVGSQAVNPRSEIHGYLREALAAPRISDEIGEAIARMRKRDPGLPRAWQYAQAGGAVVWGLLAAALGQDHERDPGPERERVARWAGRRFAEACARVAEGSAEEAVRLTAADAEKVVEEAVAAIGDPEQGLPGERQELDPLLRRSAPEA